MSEAKAATKVPKAKKDPKPNKPARVAVEPTAANLKTAREVATVTEYSLPKIRKALSCTWGEAVAVRHALLKADKS